ncbi:hypothetical protein ACFQV2_19545 [Actinokineospora soli]|uniref:Uncharacterized protein n=1 Tax=Actinokineospora soli TaxID=1048753 RepID=A0ABW2TRD9_9PSEU
MGTSRIAAVLAVALVTACSRGGADLVGSAPPVATAPDAVQLPLDAYRATTWQSGQVVLARALLIAECEGTQAPDRTVIEQDTIDRIRDFGPAGNKRRYGITSVADAAMYGYHLPSTLSPRRPPQVRHDAPRPECVRAADAELGSIKTELVSELDSASYSRSLGDPGLERVVAEWAEPRWPRST